MTSPTPPDLSTAEEPAAPEAEVDPRFLPPPAPDPEPEAEPFVAWRPRPGVFEYAFRGYGPTLVVAGTLALGSIRFGLHVAEVVGPMGVGLVAVAVLAILAFSLWWFLEVHEDSADDHHRVPQWPDPADFEGLMGSAGNWLAAVFFSGAPLGMLLVVGLSCWPSNLLVGLAGLTYLPMALSGLMSDSKVLGALPVGVVQLIGNDPLSLAASLGFALACIPTIVTRAFWDAPVPIDIGADAIAAFALLLAMRRVGVGRAGTLSV